MVQNELFAFLQPRDLKVLRVLTSGELLVAKFSKTHFFTFCNFESFRPIKAIPSRRNCKHSTMSSFEIVTITAVAELPSSATTVSPINEQKTVLEHIFDVIAVGQEHGNERAYISYAQLNGEGAFGRTRFIALQIMVRTADTVLPLAYYYVHAKVFSSGKVQLAGLKTEGDATHAVSAILCSMGLEQHTVEPRIVLINAKFRASDTAIDREVLHAYFCGGKVQPGAKLDSVYDPTHWPGVRLNVYFDATTEGNDVASNRKKKVFVGIFRSGKAVVTGATTLRQVEEACRLVTSSVSDSGCG